MRKPETGIFELAISEGAKLILGGGLKASECVMIDDLKMNLKAARALGMRTVRELSRFTHYISFGGGR